jgi:hypothetical protein
MPTSHHRLQYVGIKTSTSILSMLRECRIDRPFTDQRLKTYARQTSSISVPKLYSMQRIRDRNWSTRRVGSTDRVPGLMKVLSLSEYSGFDQPSRVQPQRQASNHTVLSQQQCVFHDKSQV